ncbi:MAG: radical SAM protein, partial [Candidatus Aenigmatarchaeota archaeon]
MKEALFYTKLVGGKVRCQLCPRRCFINPDQTGLCGVRKNTGGKLHSLVYGRPCSMSVDPIEKKPIFHFIPGIKAFSIATVGCNLFCKFCQNFEISRPATIFGQEKAPEEIVRLAIESGANSIAYTYTEPTVFYEYALDVMKLAKKAGLKNVWVSNGYTNIAPIRKMAKFLDVVNIDIKGGEEAY